MPFGTRFIADTLEKNWVWLSTKVAEQLIPTWATFICKPTLQNLGVH